MIRLLLGCCCALLIFAAGCKGKGSVRNSASLTVDGRQVTASVEGSGVFIHPDKDAAVVRFRGHKIRVEKDNLRVDSGNRTTIAPGANLVDIVVTKSDAVTVSANGVKVLSTKLR